MGVSGLIDLLVAGAAILELPLVVALAISLAHRLARGTWWRPPPGVVLAVALSLLAHRYDLLHRRWAQYAEEGAAIAYALALSQLLGPWTLVIFVGIDLPFDLAFVKVSGRRVYKQLREAEARGFPLMRPYGRRSTRHGQKKAATPVPGFEPGSLVPKTRRIVQTTPHGPVLVWACR
jgi:hypothetical protein